MYCNNLAILTLHSAGYRSTQNLTYYTYTGNWLITTQKVWNKMRRTFDGVQSSKQRRVGWIHHWCGARSKRWPELSISCDSWQSTLLERPLAVCSKAAGMLTEQDDGKVMNDRPICWRDEVGEAIVCLCDWGDACAAEEMWWSLSGGYWATVVSGERRLTRQRL